MKRNYWPLFFIGIFSFVFSMIIWTIVRTSEASLDTDESFLKKYQEVDEFFNDMMNANYEFKDNYQLKLFINGKEFNLTTEDIKYSQRVLEKISKHKNLLKVGKNHMKFFVLDKKTKQKEKVDTLLKITKSNSNKSDIILASDKFEENDKIYTRTFMIEEENSWNITGSFKVNNSTGYLYIKTNAK